MMDSDGSFIDKETIIRSSNQSVKERIKVLPSIETDIYNKIGHYFTYDSLDLLQEQDFASQ